MQVTGKDRQSLEAGCVQGCPRSDTMGTNSFSSQTARRQQGPGVTQHDERGIC